MSKLPPNKSFRREDFPGQEDWIDALISPLNQTLSSLVTALSKGLGISDNVGGSYHEFTGTIPASWTSPAPDFPYVFRHGMSRQPKAVLPAKARNETDPNEVFSFDGLQWEDLGDGRLSIKKVAGMTAGDKYTITVLILPD